MKKYICYAVSLAFISLSGPVLADDVGQREYMNFCAGCHGADGTGGGPLTPILQIETPDLTTITERTGGGDFPFYNTLKLIDGRDVRAHGGEMPLWGDRYFAMAERTERRAETPESFELIARGRLLSLVDYLRSIQK